jgi:hypothetical protein
VDIITMNAWEKMHGPRSFGVKTASTATIAKIAADQSKYLLSHATIMASVHCEDEPFDFFIRPESSIFVNQNEDAWENDVLKLSYRTFVGGFNFQEHKQNSKLSKGHILDAVLRKVHLTPEIFVHYCDILVATDLSHESLIADIRSGKTKYMSMGCLTDVVICSFCGARCTDPETYCKHLLYRKGEYLFDDEGIPRRVAELCGHKSLPGGGVHFIEASWVGTPAFPGAANRTIVVDEWTGPKTPYTHPVITGSLKVASVLSPRDEREESKQRAHFNNLF